jgi:prolyl-tRNA synthetase
MGALIMAHSDDDGLILPPRLAPIHVVIVPIYKKEEELKAISGKAEQLITDLRKQGLSIRFDNRDTYKPGFKFAEHELRGVPVRLAIGPRDLENGTVEVARRDTREKQTVKMEDIATAIPQLLEDIQENIYQRALNFRNSHTTPADTFDEMVKILDDKGGFVLAHWDGSAETEARIKEESKATIRCIPLDGREEDGKCVYSGRPSKRRVLFARAY